MFTPTRKIAAVLTGVAVAAAPLLIGNSGTAGAVSITRPVALRAIVALDATATSCDNTGSTIDVSGTVTIDGIATKLVFKNNVKGTKTSGDFVTESIIDVPVPATLQSVPKQPVRGGVGGNPWMSFQLTDEDGNALTDAFVLGRCVQGVSVQFTRTAFLSTQLAFLAQTLECSNKGSRINVGTDLSGDGIDGWLMFDNNINKVVHRAEASSTASMHLADPISRRKGWGSSSTIGGNPLIDVFFKDSLDESASWGDVNNLGRCNKLG